ncbi:MAG TPA: hypothetical protein VJT32_05930 [bacterium]|nr:hypothetical protein [bacterium]
MALLMTFPCGRCGQKYSVYYPKTFIASVYGTMTPAQADREDAEDRAAGAIEAAQRRAESEGKIWIDVSQQSKVTCTCGKTLNLNLADHPRVPQRKGVTTGTRQTGVIAFPEVPKKRHS